MLKEEIIKQTNKMLIQRFQPFLIIIFGSFATGQVRPDSDLDVAFFTDKEVQAEEIFAVSEELANFVGRDVDLIDLTKASTVFSAQIVGKGRVIYCNDETRRMNYMLRTFKEYALLNEERAVILERIKERGYIYGK